MSTYMYVFARHPHSLTFTEIYWACRSSEFFQTLYETGAVPYEKVARLEDSTLREAVTDLEQQINSLNKEDQEARDLIKAIGTWNNDVESKRNAIDALREEINQREESRADYQHALDVINGLRTLDAELWAGIEVSEEITKDEICDFEKITDLNIDSE